MWDHEFVEPAPAAQADEAAVREIAERWAAGGLRDEVAIPMLASSREAYAAGRDAGAVLAADAISEWMQIAREIGFDAGRAQGARDIRSEAIDWAQFPKLARIFEHRPRVNVYWEELSRLVAIAARGKDGTCTT